MTTTAVEALAVAFGHHQRGELAQAKAIYRQILEADPMQADAWHRLGVVAHQEGRHADAVDAIARAIAIDAAQPAFHNHLGAAHAALADMERAEASFRRALALAPADPQIHYNLAALLGLRGKVAEAVDHYRRAIQLQPRMAEAHFNLGNLLRDREDWAGAEQCYTAALAARPRYAKALTSLAAVWQRQGQADRAEGAWRQACDLHRETLRLHPRHVEAHVGLGSALQSLGQFAEAKACYHRALELRPHDGMAEFNLGSALLSEGHYDEAEAYFRSVLAREVDNFEARFRLGQCLQFQGQFDAAIGQYDQVLTVRPAHAECHYYRATSWLTKGDFARGWPEYEWRLKTRYAGPAYPQRRWHGEPLTGDKIILHAEWGMGDTVQFLRYVPLVEARGGDVFLAVQPSLIPLLEQSGFKQLSAWRADPHSECQWQVPLLSLPGIFGTTLETIPAKIPYLSADAARVARWRERLGEFDGLSVGIHWHGSKAWSTDLRPIPLVEFAPLAALEGVRLVSLQKNDDLNQLQGLADRFSVIDFGDELDAEGGAFLDTAAIMRQLDVVVTSDTGTAHVAGALGVPVWVALPSASEWRWQWTREDSPWYPTMRLFRQSRPHDWTGVFRRIADELAPWARKRRREGPPRSG